MIKALRRETKLNLMFLSLFVAISLPGAVILFRKKLNPQSRPIFMSDAVDRRVPYMAAGQTPMGYKRVIPPLTERWVAELVRQHTGDARVLAQPDARDNAQPILSDDHQLQLVAMRQEGKQATLDLVWWEPGIDAESSKLSARLVQGNQTLRAPILRTEMISLPQDIKLELINLGLLKVPKSVMWLEVSATSASSGTTPIELEVHGSTSSFRLHPRLVLPQSSHPGDHLHGAIE